MNRDRVHPGFTLIEMLIAMAIIALIMSMVYGSYAATTQSVRRHEGQTACRKRADLVLRLMARQIRCAYLPASDPNTNEPPRPGARDTSLSGPAPAVYGLFRGTGQNPQGEFLTFLTTAGPSAGMKTSPTLSFVSYRYDPAEEAISIRQWPCAGRPADNSDSPWQPILDRVTDIELEFHDGHQWQRDWNDRRSGSVRLPRAVRISLALLDEQGRRYETGTTVPIVCHAEVQMGKSRTPQVAGTL